MIFVSLFKRRGKLIKLLEVKCETERTTVPVRYLYIESSDIEGPRIVKQNGVQILSIQKI